MEELSDDDPRSEHPLAGVRILDLTRVLAGPLGTMVLSDLGANVLKVEGPGGDETRAWGPPFAGTESAYFLAMNRNKRSVVLDLNNPEDADRFVDLVPKADVIVENFRPGRMSQWGFGPDAMMDLNPRLVYCSITGFGDSGPYRDFPGFDPVIEAMSGLMSINGPPDLFEPYKVGVAIIDVLAGLYAANVITSLLLRRAKTGRGGNATVSLLDVSIASLVNVMSSYLISRDLPQRHGNDHPNIVPFGVFGTQDGLVMICAGNDRQWRSLCEVLDLNPADHPDLADNPSRVDRRDHVRRLLEERLVASSAADWAQKLMEHGVPAGAIRTLDQVVSDPHVIESGLIREIEHPTAGPISLVAAPFKIDGNRPDIRLSPPLLDADQRAIEDWLGAPSSQGDTG